jgi:multiple sugar transport system permease protein
VYLIIAPFFVLFFAFCVLPFIMTLTTAFTDYNAAGIPQFVGFENFAFVAESASDGALTDALVFLLTFGLGGLLASITAAWFISLMPRGFRPFFAAAFFAPFLAGNILFGIGFLALLAGILTVPRERFEAAELEGVRNRFQTLFYITLPAIKPQFFFALIMQTAAAFNSVSAAQNYGAVFEIGRASAASLLVFLPMLAIYLGLLIIFRRCAK